MAMEHMPVDDASCGSQLFRALFSKRFIEAIRFVEGV